MGAQQSKDQFVFYGDGVPVKITGEVISAIEEQERRKAWEHEQEQGQTIEVKREKTVEEQVEEKVALELSRHFLRKQNALEKAQAKSWSSEQLTAEIKALDAQISKATNTNANSSRNLAQLELLQDQVVSCYNTANNDPNGRQLDCWSKVEQFLSFSQKAQKDHVAGL